MPETPCCLSVDLLLLAFLTLRITMSSMLPDENGERIGRAPQSEGRKDRRDGNLIFLVLAATYAALFYLIHVEPEMHAGRPIHWEAGFQCVISPMLTGLIYNIIASVIIVKMYRPDS